MRNVKGLLDHLRNFTNVGDQIAVFHNAQRHAVKISLLKRALADHGLWHLTSDGDQWHAVHPCVSNAGHEVGGAGAAGGHAHADLS